MPYCLCHLFSQNVLRCRHKVGVNNMSSLLLWISIGLAPLAGYGIDFIYSRCRHEMKVREVDYTTLANDESLIIIPSLRPPFPKPTFRTLVFSFASMIVLGIISQVGAERLPLSSGSLVVCSVVVFMWLSAFDLMVFRLPDRLTGTAYLILMAASILSCLSAQTYAPIAYALFGSVVFASIWLFPALVAGGGMIGFGDIKLCLPLGCLLGMAEMSFLSTLSTILFAAFVGSCLGAVGGLLTRAVKKNSIQYPFGPYLILGALIVFALQST